MVKPPKDRYNAVWLIFFMLGLGTLLPWNFFMTATMYFTSRLGDDVAELSDVRALAATSEPDLTVQMSNATSLRLVTNVTAADAPRNVLQDKFNNVMTLCAMLPLLVFTCLNSVLHQRISQNIRIMGSLAAIFLVFLLTAIFVKIHFAPLTFFIVTMVKIVFINMFGALLQGSLFGLAALFPASYTAPVMSGQGLAGTFAAFAMICALASGSALTDSAFGYFIMACVVIALALLSYLALHKLEFYRYYALENKAVTAANTSNAEQETKVDLLNTGEKISEEGSMKNPTEKPSIIRIFKKMWVLALSVCFVFTVTIGIFPAVTADTKSSIAGTSNWGTYFIPVSCFLLFNLCDWAGRSLTAVCMWPGKDSKLLPVMVAARVVFVPLFMLCNVHPRRNLPPYLAHDAWFICIMLVFGVSNGYLASLCMCFGPKKVAAHEAETAGAIMAFFLSLGLALGAGFSFPLRILV
ncbi:equilibrative nucleoside transporter 1 [Ascaphus truei]|uniref:equilibrative nucleoside transporter 1 n=1 Tax=Ascaphus truei TaxID=8439 RepID=UPI003F5AA2C5